MEEEEIKKRFSEEITALGATKNSIAVEVGFSAQTFTNVAKGRNLPSVLLLHKIQKSYPSFDANYVITGIRIGDDSEEVKNLRSDLRREKAIVSSLLGKSKGASSHPQVDREGYSELLVKSIRKNMRNSNRLLLSGSWKFTSPN